MRFFKGILKDLCIKDRQPIGPNYWNITRSCTIINFKFLIQSFQVKYTLYLIKRGIHQTKFKWSYRDY